MNIFEIVSAIILIIACVFIVVIIQLKDTKTQMSQSISGTSSDSFFQKNAGRTKEAMLNKATIAAVIIFFVLALAVNVINVYWGGKEEVSDTSSSSVVSDIEDSSETSDETSSEEVSSDTAESSEDTSTSSTVSAE